MKKPPNNHANKYWPIFMHPKALFYYGWIIVAILFLAELIGSPTGGPAISLFFVPMADSLGWSLSQVVGAVTAKSVAGMVVAPFMGAMLDRYGARLILTFGFLFAGIALLFVARVNEIWQLWILFALIGALSVEGAGRLSTPVVLSKWFVRRRSRAIAIASSGQLLGGALMAPIIGLMIGKVGWRSTWKVLGIAMVVVNVPLMALLMRNKPEDVGLQPDGAITGTENAENQELNNASMDALQEESWTLKEAIKSRTLWTLLSVFTLITFTGSAVIYHQVNFFTGQGMSRQFASYVMSTTFLLGVLARLFWGLAMEHTSVRNSVIVMSMCRAIGTLALIATPYPFNMVGFLLFWGLLGGAFGLLQPVAFANYFGRRYQGSIQGAVRPFLELAHMLGPLATAVAFDSGRSYQFAFGIAFGLASAASVIALSVSPPIKRTKLPS